MKFLYILHYFWKIPSELPCSYREITRNCPLAPGSSQRIPRAGGQFLVISQYAQRNSLALLEFQSLDEVKTLVYMEVYILSEFLSLEELFI